MTEQASQPTEAPEVAAEPIRASNGREADHDDLLAELARAMHAAAASQYERISAELERRRADQVAAIATHAGSEVEYLKAGTDTDIRAIDAWAKSETEKIKVERLHRIDARREQLAGQLERQETIKSREVFAVEAAIDAHRTEIERFFGRMERETDPAAIARVAATLPPFPALDEIAEMARRGAAADLANPGGDAEPAPATGDLETERLASESQLIGVMDPAAALGGTSEAAPAWDSAPYAVSVAAGSTLLRSTPSIRPAGRSEPASDEAADLQR